MSAIHAMPMAASSVTWPFSQRSNRVTATICEFGPTSRIGIETARTAMRNRNSQQVIIAGATRGMTMRRKVPTSPAPDTADASSSSVWICNKPA